MGTEGKIDKDNMETSGSKGKLISSNLKEVTEFISDLFPVLGSIFFIIVLLVQYWYSITAESFYGIDKSLFYYKNLVYFVTITISTLGLYVALFLSYCNLHNVHKKDCQAIIIMFIFDFGSMITPLFVLMMKLPNLIVFIVLIVLGIVVVILDIVLSNKSNHKAENIYIVIKIIIILCFLFTIYAYMTVSSKSEIESKQDYEIAFPVDSNNTDWYYGSKNNDSQIFDIVILHKDSQVLLMKGKIEKAQLTLYKGVYSFQDIDKYAYMKKNFTKGVSLTEESPSEATQTEASPSELSK